MVAEQDVLNQIVKRAPKAKPINVKDTVAEQDVLNQIVKRAPEAKPINV
jgi:hypothetical protein